MLDEAAAARKDRAGRLSAAEPEPEPEPAAARAIPPLEPGNRQQGRSHVAASEAVEPVGARHKQPPVPDGALAQVLGSFAPSEPPKAKKSVIGEMASSLPDKAGLARAKPDRQASRAHDGPAARARLGAKREGTERSVTNEMRSHVRTNNEQNARAFQYGATPDLPLLPQLVDTMRSYQQHLMASQPNTSKSKDVKKLMALVGLRNRAAYKDVLAKCCLAKVSRIADPTSQWDILKGECHINGGGEVDEYHAYRAKAKLPNGCPENFGLVMVVRDTDKKRTAVATKAKVTPILSIMQGGQYVQNMLIFTNLQLLAKIELATALLERLTAKETEARVPMGDAPSDKLRQELNVVEDALAEFGESAQAKNKACKLAGTNTFDFDGPIKFETEAISELLDHLMSQVVVMIDGTSTAMREL